MMKLEVVSEKDVTTTGASREKVDEPGYELKGVPPELEEMGR